MNDSRNDIDPNSVCKMEIKSEPEGESSDEVKGESNCASEEELSHVGEKSYKCNICDKNFKYRFIKSHILSHNEEKTFECNVCGKKFIDPCGRRYHLKSHTKEKPHECNICGKKYKYSFTFRRHQLTHIEEQSNECGLCGKKFRRKKLKLQNSSGEKLCNVCSKKKRYSSSFRYHSQSSHEKEKSLDCNLCGQKFNLLSEKEIHLCTDKTKPYKCSVCQKEFYYLFDLQTHSNSEHCQSIGSRETVTQSTNPTAAVQTYTRVKPHECNVCGKKFSLLSNLATHLLIHNS